LTSKKGAEMADPPITITPIPLLSDNYAWALRSGEDVAVIDPGEAGPVIRFLERIHARLSAILVTHHHGDHCGGVGVLKRTFGCTVIGARDKRMPFVDDCAGNGDIRTILGTRARVIATPGHTLTHVVYFFQDLRALFTGDTFFSAGCGRIFEGNTGQMFESLTTCAGLGDDVLIYAGHEYTEENLRFAQSVEPGNAAVHARLLEVRQLRGKGLSTLPSPLSIEKTINPFLRTNNPQIRGQLGMEKAFDIDVFAELRKRKNRF